MALMERYNALPEGTPYHFTHTSGTHIVVLNLNRDDFLRYSDLDGAVKDGMSDVCSYGRIDDNHGQALANQAIAKYHAFRV